MLRRNLIGGVALGLFAALLSAISSGPDARYTSAPGENPAACATAGCHAAATAAAPLNAFGGFVTATFSDGPNYTPGKPVTITVTVFDPAPTNRTYGFQMTARLESDKARGQAGTFTAPNSSMFVLCENNAPRRAACPATAPIEFIEHSRPATAPWTFTWTPPASSIGSVYFYVASSAVNNDGFAGPADHIYTASFVLAVASNTPSVTSVVNLASGEQLFAPGALAAIFGTNLAASLAQPDTVPTSVLVNGRLGAVLISTPQQLTVQFPVEESAVGPVSLIVLRGTSSSAQQILTLSAYAPGIFIATGNFGSIWHGDGSPVTLASPAEPGEALSLICTGLGPTSPVVPTGVPAPANPRAITRTTPSVTVGSQSAIVQSASLEPGTIGTFRVFFSLPTSLLPGSYSLSLQISGRTSNNVSVPIAGFAISGLNPNTAVAGQAGFTLSVSGNGFLAGSIVRWNGLSLATTYSNSSLLTAAVPETLVANPGTASVTVLNPGGALSNSFLFTIQPRALTIITASTLPGGTVGVSYSQALAAAGGATPYKGWAVIAGSLPPGIALATLGGVLNGLLNGTPTVPGTFVFTVQVTDATNNNAVKQLSLTVNASPILLSGVVNAASYVSGSVAPGEIVTIFGSYAGPATLLGLQLDNRGYVSANLSGNQVLFDGVPGPIIYAVAGQFSAVVPYSVSGKSSTQVQIVYPGGSSNAVSVPVSASAPGLFTVNSSGQGQGAIVNQDGTVNSSSNPARVGSTVFVYGTGEGQTSPPGIDGKPGDAPAPRPVGQPVTATVGGLDAQVVYAGGVPGLVSGVLQVNVQIPETVIPGGATPIMISIGGRTSQTGVTLAVR